MLIDFGGGKILNDLPVVVAGGAIHAPGCAQIPDGAGESTTWLLAIQSGAAVCPTCGGHA